MGAVEEEPFGGGFVEAAGADDLAEAEGDAVEGVIPRPYGGGAESVQFTVEGGSRPGVGVGVGVGELIGRSGRVALGRVRWSE